MVGWVVWFASVVASVLYALGFAFFAANAIDSVFQFLSLSLPFSVTAKSSILFWPAVH
jgi:hypothetical protein